MTRRYHIFANLSTMICIIKFIGVFLSSVDEAAFLAVVDFVLFLLDYEVALSLELYFTCLCRR